jgi:hypothetical protein
MYYCPAVRKKYSAKREKLTSATAQTQIAYYITPLRLIYTSSGGIVSVRT